MLSSLNSYSQKRVLMLFADNSNNKHLKSQLALLSADQKGVDERDIAVKTFYAGTDQKTFNMRKIKSPFAVILIGKDGGEKLRSTSPVTLKNMYGLIDAMPMRKIEMQRRP